MKVNQYFNISTYVKKIHSRGLTGTQTTHVVGLDPWTSTDKPAHYLRHHQGSTYYAGLGKRHSSNRYSAISVKL